MTAIDCPSILGKVGRQRAMRVDGVGFIPAEARWTCDAVGTSPGRGALDE